MVKKNIEWRETHHSSSIFQVLEVVTFFDGTLGGQSRKDHENEAIPSFAIKLWFTSEFEGEQANNFPLF